MFHGKLLVYFDDRRGMRCLHNCCTRSPDLPHRVQSLNSGLVYDAATSTRPQWWPIELVPVERHQRRGAKQLPSGLVRPQLFNRRPPVQRRISFEPNPPRRLMPQLPPLDEEKSDGESESSDAGGWRGAACSGLIVQVVLPNQC